MRLLRGWSVMAVLFLAGDLGGAEPPAKPFVFDPECDNECFCVSRDGKKLAINWWAVFDIPTGKRLLTGKTRGASSMDFSPDGKLLAVGGNYSELYVYDDAGKVYWDLTLVGHGDTIIRQVAFTRDGRHLVSTSANGMLRVWDVRDKKAVALFCFKSDRGGHYNGYEEFLRAWRALNGNKAPDGVRTFAVLDQKPIGTLYQFSVSPDGTSVALAVGTSEALQIELATGRILKRFRTGQVSTLAVGFSEDGKLLAVGGGDAEYDTGKCTVEVWDVATGTRLVTCPGHNGSVGRLVFCPDGKLLFSSGGNDGVCAWDVSTGKEKFRLHKGEKTSVIGVGLLPDGKTLLTLPDKKGESVHFWDAATGKPVAPAVQVGPKP